MSRSQRDKGARAERDLVYRLREAGLDAKRVPLSGACEGFKGDVVVTPHNPEILQSLPLVFECKVRAKGFKFLYDNLPDDGVLAVKRDRDEWLIVERLSDWAKRL